MNLTSTLVGALGLVVVYIVLVYNSLVQLRMRIKEALSGIDVQLKRRIDLIPNLVETVKGYAKHESEVFEKVTEARSSLMSAQTTSTKAEANNMLTDSLKSLFAVAEAYPELKANENFLQLQRQLEDTEDKVAFSRQFYNTNVLALNTKIQTFPSNLIANAFGFSLVEFFEATEDDRKDVKVTF